MMSKKNKKPVSAVEEFMKLHIPIQDLFKVGFFTKEMRGDYDAMSKRVCDFFGYNSIFEYNSERITCHLSHPRTHFVNHDGELETQPFLYTQEPHNFFNQ